MKHSAIQWTEHTWNPWVGCLKVSQGCKHCYMYRIEQRFGRDPRSVRRTAPQTFNSPLKWMQPAFVFTCSMSDFFIDEADEWRDDAWQIIRDTPHLTYQILTKRPHLIKDRLPADWGEQGYPNVWLGTSAENQETLQGRMSYLRFIPARVRFVSAEPLLGPLNIGLYGYLEDLHWIIAGGESGPDHRPMDLTWARDLRDQCQEFGVPFFFKQVGGNHKIAGHWGGNELDGSEHLAMPPVIQPDESIQLRLFA